MSMKRRPVPFIIGLTLVAGGLDALGYFRLGHVFVANMTGNLVLLAVALARGHADQAMRSLWALAGFMAGAMGGSVMAQSRRVRGLIVAEAVSLAVMGAFFWQGAPPPPWVPWTIAAGGFAMGLQSRLARLVNVGGTTTTVVTSTLTQMMDDIQHLWRKLPTPPGFSARVAVFLAYAVGAMLSALGRHDPLWVLTAALLLCVSLLGLGMPLRDDSDSSSGSRYLM